jgi:hypothetical protein
MLELIILGQIPGTNIYLNFSAIAVAILIFGAVIGGRTLLKRSNLQTHIQQEVTQNNINSQTI